MLNYRTASGWTCPISRRSYNEWTKTRAVLTVGHRHRRWPTVKTTSGESPASPARRVHVEPGESNAHQTDRGQNFDISYIEPLARGWSVVPTLRRTARSSNSLGRTAAVLQGVDSYNTVNQRLTTATAWLKMVQLLLFALAPHNNSPTHSVLGASASFLQHFKHHIAHDIFRMQWCFVSLIDASVLNSFCSGSCAGKINWVY